MNIIIHDHGINWMHYAEVEITHGGAKVINTWRAHKFEERGYIPKRSRWGSVRRGDVNIQKWVDDGKPGGVKGLRANYKRPPYIVIYRGNTNHHPMTFRIIE